MWVEHLGNAPSRGVALMAGDWFRLWEGLTGPLLCGPFRGLLECLRAWRPRFCQSGSPERQPPERQRLASCGAHLAPLPEPLREALRLSFRMGRAWAPSSVTRKIGKRILYAFRTLLHNEDAEMFCYFRLSPGRKTTGVFFLFFFFCCFCFFENLNNKNNYYLILIFLEFKNTYSN